VNILGIFWPKRRKQRKKALFCTAGDRTGDQYDRAKAYDSAIQKCVVLMKDELEKAKEQVLNVL